MPIAFACPNCGKQYRVDDALAGKTRTCKGCSQPLRIPDQTPTGQPIYRHEERQREFEPATGDEQTIEAISQHIEQHFGAVAGVYHEILSDLVHLDVHMVAPTEEMPFWKLITSGMSDRPMTVPEGAEDYRFGELLICLPPDWKLNQQDFEDENNYWPVRLLKMLGRLPHEYGTWIGPGHTIPNGGEEPEPYAANTKFVCALILPACLAVPSEFKELQTPDGRTIHFYAIWPIYEDEMNYKLSQGLDALIDRFDEGGVTEVVDVRRRSCCSLSPRRPVVKPKKKKKPWWQFW